MNDCKHFKRQGDNYGVSCQTCGEQLEGYGFGGFFGSEKCIHMWDKSDPQMEECKYCFIIRERLLN